MENPVNLGSNLHEAVRQGNLERVKELINQGADVNYINDIGDTPLLTAIGKKDTNIVKVLLENGADVNFVSANRYNQSPLLKAIITKNNKEIFDLIINHPSFDTQNINNNIGALKLTPLMYACIDGSVDLLQPLIDKGADVNAKDENGTTAIFMALSWYDHYKNFINKNLIFTTIQILLNNGANLNTDNHSAYDLLQAAIKTENIPLVELILEFGVGGLGAGVAPQAGQITKEDIKKALQENINKALENEPNYEIYAVLIKYLDILKRITLKQGGKRKNTRKNRKTRKSIKKRV